MRANDARFSGPSGEVHRDARSAANPADTVGFMGYFAYYRRNRHEGKEFPPIYRKPARIRYFRRSARTFVAFSFMPKRGAPARIASDTKLGAKWP